MELGFLVDTSLASFSPMFFPKVLQTIKTIYGSFVINQQKTRVGVVLYNGGTSTFITLNQFGMIDQIDDAVGTITQSASNIPGNLGEALSYTYSNLFKPNTRIQTPAILVVITGAKSRDSVTQAALQAQHGNVTIFVIGAGSNVDRAELMEVASPYPENHLIMGAYSVRDSSGENLASRIKKAVQVDLLFLIDGSSAVPKANFIYILDAIKYICSAFPISKDDIHVGLGVVSTNLEIAFDLDKYFTKPTLNSAIDSVVYPGGRGTLNLGQAFLSTKTKIFDRSSRKLTRKVLVVVLAGNPQDQYSSEVKILRDSKVEIFVLGVGTSVQGNVYEEIASVPPNKHIVKGIDIDDLNPGALDIIEKLQIAKVRNNIPPPNVIPPAPSTINGIIDLVILIDVGDNTRPQEFEQIKEIIKATYRFFPISKHGTHVAFVILSSKIRIVFNLFSYFTITEMDNAVDSTPYPGGSSFIGNALYEVKIMVFDTYGRPGVPHVLITVLTGSSKDPVDVPANQLKSSCILMFTMGIGTNYHPADVDKISSSPRSEYVLIGETFPDDVSLGTMMASKIYKVISVVKAWSTQCVQRGDTKVDIVFLVEACQNIPSPSFPKVTEIVKTTMTTLPTGETNVAILTFANEAKVLKDLQSNKDIGSALAEAKSSEEGCNIDAGLQKIREIFQSQARHGVPKLLVILSGGKWDGNVTAPADDLRRSGVIIFVVGLGQAADLSSLGVVASSPPASFVIQEPNFPFSTNIQNVLAKQIEGIFDIGNELLCNTCIAPTSLPLPHPTLPISVNCGLHAENRIPLDIVFLIDASDSISDQNFQSLINIAKITYSQFPISMDYTHVAMVIYGSAPKVLFNLGDLPDARSMDSALSNLMKVGGFPKIGSALKTVSDSVFLAKSRHGVPKKLIHMMCGKTIDDVVLPSKQLHDMGVLVIAAGACPSVSKPELCVIGSPPTCDSALMMKTMHPPSAPACEFVERLLRGVPPKVMTTIFTPTNRPSVILPVPTEKAPSSSVFGIHVPIPVPIPVPVDPFTHHPLPGHISHGIYYPPFHAVPPFGMHRVPHHRPFSSTHRYHYPAFSYLNVPSINNPHFKFGPPKIGKHPLGFGSSNIFNPPIGFGSSDNHRHRHPYALHPNVQNPSLGYGSYPNSPNANTPLDYGGYEHPSIDTISKEDGYTPPDPYVHPLTDTIPNEHHITPVIHESEKYLYTGPPVIDPINPDAGFVHPATHHVVHNGKVYTHRPKKVEETKFSPIPVARPVGAHGMGYSLEAFEPDGSVGDATTNNYKPTGFCVDIDPECTSYTQSGFCDDGAVGYSQDYLTQNCKKTCGLCNEDLTQDNPDKDVWMKKHKIPFKVKHIINKAATLKATQQRKNKH